MVPRCSEQTTHLNEHLISGPLLFRMICMAKHHPFWSQMPRPTTRQALAPSKPMALLAKLILFTDVSVINASARAWLEEDKDQDSRLTSRKKEEDCNNLA